LACIGAIVTGSPRVTPPSAERTATMFEARCDQKTSVSAPFAWTTGITPVTGRRIVAAADQVTPPSLECCTASLSSPCCSPTSVYAR
jgi:hypothetical protein